ncbi:hypothetical protein OVS_03425 [Mycoplasma ovis str. Michigan]|uniref:Uncharacterized protein n=1 Tax=Mycoplasma ovis str. Michigan TaxID=1415773 RepID=A0ABN4BLT5_9MOLU|nr:hypothetical protein [Mycoplasma ovis]AHC40436.1 hypothetical protein OVS_03425 [Mycoplasma ovis str. Michigan]
MSIIGSLASLPFLSLKNSFSSFKSDGSYHETGIKSRCASLLNEFRTINNNKEPIYLCPTGNDKLEMIYYEETNNQHKITKKILELEANFAQNSQIAWV